MHNLIKLKGISQQQTAHQTPILYSFSPKNRQEKSGSLIEKCFKSVMKQRMTGCLMNIGLKKLEKQRLYGKRERNDSCEGNCLENSRKECKTYRNVERNNNYHDQLMLSERKRQNSQKKRHCTSLSLHHSLKKNVRNVNYSQEKKKITKPLQLIRHGISGVVITNDDNNENKQTSITATGTIKPSNIAKIKLQSSFGLIRRSFQLLDQAINIDLWRCITLDQSKQFIKRRSSISYNDSNDYPIISSTIKQQKQLKIKYGNSTRQMLGNFIRNLPACMKRLVQLVFYFLDIKIPIQFSYQYYIGIVEQILNIHERIWAVICFLFWDTNRDGVINSKDIFQVFQQYQNFGEQKEKSGGYVRKVSFMGNTMIDECKIQNVGQLQNVKKAVSLFDREIKRISNLLAEEVESQKYVLKDDKNVSYLQEILITKPNLKFKQVANILVQLGPLRKGNTKIDHKSQLWSNQLSVCGVSSYQQCFIATEHNEQTRNAKQKLEKLKNELKMKRKTRNKDILYKIQHNLQVIRDITYTNVVESQMGYTMKQIVRNLLGYQLIG